MQGRRLANRPKSEKNMRSNLTFSLSAWIVAVLLFGEIFSLSLAITGKSVMLFVILLNTIAKIARSPAFEYMFRLTFVLYLVYGDQLSFRAY